MTILLDTIELPDLVWGDSGAAEFSSPPVSANVEQSIINTPIVFEGESASGRAIDLVGGPDTAWITRSVLVSLYALASVAGTTYTLDYEDVEYTVRFRNEDRPVISAVPLVARPNAGDADYYRNVIIKLMEV